MSELTSYQRRYMREIRSFEKRNGHTPTKKQLAKLLGYDLSSVYRMIRKLEEMGYLKRVECPFCKYPKAYIKVVKTRREENG